MPYQSKYYRVINDKNAMYGKIGLYIGRVGGFYSGAYKLRFPDGYTAAIFSDALQLSDKESYLKQLSQ